MWANYSCRLCLFFGGGGWGWLCWAVSGTKELTPAQLTRNGLNWDNLNAQNGQFWNY